jgi:hypothetical protein
VVLFTDQDSFEGTLSLNNTNYTVKVSPGFQGQSFGQLNELDVIKSGSSFNWPVANQVEISSWITFTEKDNMFTFKYPKDLFVKEGSSIYEAPFATACPSCLGQSAFGIAVTISPNVNNLSSEAYAAKIEKIDQPNAVFIKNKPSYFGGLDVTIADGLNGGGNPGPNVFIAKNGKIIEFETEGVGVEQLNKIFSTLKFLN